MLILACFFEDAVAGGELEFGFGGVLGDDEGVWGEELAAGGAAEEAEGLGVVGFALVGRVEEDDVDGDLEFLQELGDAAIFQRVAAGDFEGGEVGAERLQGGCAVFCEPDAACATADGLDADGAGAAVEIDEITAGQARGDDVEEGLAESVAGGAGGGAGGRDEETRTVGSGDDAHWSMVLRLAGILPRIQWRDAWVVASDR